MLIRHVAGAGPSSSQGASLGGIWIIWSHRKQQASSYTEELKAYRKALEVLLEVEYKEQLYFHRADAPLEPQLRESITNGDGQALLTFLNIARMATDADLTYLGAVANYIVEVAWHVGTTESGFGFELPVGEGVGGRAFARQEAFYVDDYRNCEYRYPGVAEIGDKRPCTKITIDYKKRWFVQNKPTTCSTQPRILVQSRSGKAKSNRRLSSIFQNSRPPPNRSKSIVSNRFASCEHSSRASEKATPASARRRT